MLTLKSVAPLLALASLASAQVTKLNGLLVENGEVAGGTLNIEHVLTSPDSERVVYLAAQDTSGVIELYSVPAAGGPTVKLNGPLVSGSSIDSLFVKIPPDSARVIYFADQETATFLEFFSVPVSGNAEAVKLEAGLYSGDRIRSFSPSPQMSPNGSHMIFGVRRNNSSRDGVASIAALASAPKIFLR